MHFKKSWGLRLIIKACTSKDPEGCRSLEEREQRDLGRLCETVALHWALKIMEDLCKWKEQGRNSRKDKKIYPGHKGKN